jgi:pseudoazurin
VADTASDEPRVSGVRQHIIKGVVTQWDPMVLFVQPGDQIVFKQMTGHDSASLEGMIPEGADTWHSKLGEEGFAITLDVAGVYMYVCTPHISLGMIGAIVVGDTPPHNLAAIEAHPQNKGMIGRAVRKLKQALETAE